MSYTKGLDIYILIELAKLALKYLEHPDVKSMAFALPSECVANRLREAISKTEGGTKCNK